MLQDTGALAAAEHGRLVVWAHSPLFSGLGAASIAAGRCISAGATPRPLTRFRFLFELLIVPRILRLYSILVFPEKSKVCSFFSLLLFLLWTGRYHVTIGEQSKTGGHSAVDVTSAAVVSLLFTFLYY